MSNFTSLGIMFFRPPPDNVDALALVANTPERVAVPAGYNLAIMSSTANFYALVGGSEVTSAVPGDVDDGTASELNPAGYALNSATQTHISFISPTTCTVTIAYYSIK